MISAAELHQGQYPLILQVGSSVTRDRRLVGDIDVIALSRDVRTPFSRPKEIFRKEGHFDLEVSYWPCSLPALLASDPDLHFLLFRERRKLEYSKRLFGEKRDHQHLLRSLRSLPLPVQPILKLLRQVEGAIEERPRDRGLAVRNFFTLTMLLGYTHFPLGPVKPKWMYHELSEHGGAYVMDYLSHLLRPLQGEELLPLIAEFAGCDSFQGYWKTAGTAWQDTLFLAEHHEPAAALALLYCLHAYSNSRRASTESDGASVFYRKVVAQIDSETLSLLADLSIRTAESIRSRL